MSDTITRDDAFDIDSLIVDVASTQPADTNCIAERPTTPLENLINMSSGMELTNDEIDAALSTGVRSNGSLKDESLEAVSQTLKNMDELIEKAGMLEITESPKNDVELASLIDTLDSFSVDDILKAQNAAMSESIISQNGGTAVGLDIDAETKLSTDSSVIVGSNVRVKTSRKVTTNDAVDNAEQHVDLIKRDECIQVIIDKTGLGVDFAFTDDEKSKIQNSTRIDLVQIQDESLRFLSVKEPDEGFLGSIKNDMYKILGASTTLPLIGSRYRASFRGLAYGEFADLALSTNVGDVEVLNRRCSIFYNSIVETSVGMFPDYESFLKHTATVDLPMLTLGTYIATNPEIMEVAISCQKDGCKKNFLKSFSPRNLLDLSSLSSRFLEIMKTVSTVKAGTPAKEYHLESTVLSKTRIRLPKSNIICNFGLVSCYDAINYRLPFINDVERYLAAKYPDDINGVHAIIPLVAEIVSSIIVKDSNNKDVVIKDIGSMADILFNIPVEDFDIITEIGAQTSEDYAYSFSVRDVICPECGTFTSGVEIDLDKEVFSQLQAQKSTRINPVTLPRL